MTIATTSSSTLRSEAHGVPVKETVDLLRRWAFLERACIRAMAGWFLLVRPYEVKIAMGHALWGHAERTDALRRRLAEMRGGHHEANLDPQLAQIGTALLDAPHEAGFMAGYRRVIEHLMASYHSYLTQADPAANAVEIRLLSCLAGDVQQTANRLEQMTDAVGGDGDAHGRYIAGLLQLSSDAGARPSPVHRYQRPDSILFDDRVTPGRFDSYDDRLTLAFEQKRIAECEIYFNEFYAAGLLATILLDAWAAAAPWEFFHDLSHHFYDEVRHAEFGMVRLRELGVEPSRVDLSLMERAATMPFLHRLCYLTLGLEVYFMPRKRPRVKRYGDAGDARTQLFADVDWSDEGNHVQYGRRWVAFFLENDARSVEEVQDEIASHMAAASPGMRAGELAPY